MAKWIAVPLVIAIAFVGGMWVHAQTPRGNTSVQPPPQIISGADFGFRVDSVGADGTINGKIVVRQNGQWVEVVLTGGVRRLKTN